MPLLDPELAATVECRLVTTGRTSGAPREIRIWFASNGDRLYLLSGDGDRAHWVRNAVVDPRVQVQIATRTFQAHARVISTDEPIDAVARTAWATKYGTKGFETFLRDALPVAVDLEREIQSEPPQRRRQ